MPVTPTGILSAPLAAMRELIAASPTFQVWVGAPGDEEAAKARIHLCQAPENSPRPLALVEFGDFARLRDTLGNGKPWVQRSDSNLVIWFRADATPGDEPDPTIEFCNTAGAVWTDMEKAAGVYEKAAFPANLIELVVAPQRTDEEHRGTAGDYFETAISPSFTRQPL